jgi:hypothetical protein
MNCTDAPSHVLAADHSALYAFITALVNLVLTVIVPYMFKLRPVQRVLHPHRLEHRRALQNDLSSCISSMQQLAKTLSERSESSSDTQKNSKRIDTLAV